MTGFTELTSPSGRRIIYMDGVLSVRESGKILYRMEGWEAKDYFEAFLKFGHWIRCQSEDAEENECDCWKKGLE